jgi:hypothetical protein
VEFVRVDIVVVFGWGCCSIMRGHATSCRWLANGLLGSMVPSGEGGMYWLCGDDGGWLGDVVEWMMWWGI